MKRFKKNKTLFVCLVFCGACSKQKIKKEIQENIYKSDCKAISLKTKKLSKNDKKLLLFVANECEKKAPTETIKVLSQLKVLSLSKKESEKIKNKQAEIFYKISPQNAIKEWTELLQISPQNATYKKNLIKSFYKTRNFKQTKQMIQNELENKQKNKEERAGLLLLLAKTNKALGEKDMAEKNLLEIKKKHNYFYKKNKVFLYLSSFYEELYRYEKAIRTLEEVKRKRPKLKEKIERLKKKQKNKQGRE